MLLLKPRLLRLAPGLLVLLTLPACGSGEFFHKVYPVTGSITFKGQPLAEALVTFHPVDPSILTIPKGEEGPVPLSPMATTDADGTFALSTYYADDGAPAGAYKVTVAWSPPAPSVEDSDFQSPGARPPVKNGVDPRYARAASTTLEATVTPDGDNQFAFEVD